MSRKKSMLLCQMNRFVMINITTGIVPVATYRYAVCEEIFLLIHSNDEDWQDTMDCTATEACHEMTRDKQQSGTACKGRVGTSACAAGDSSAVTLAMGLARCVPVCLHTFAHISHSYIYLQFCITFDLNRVFP